MSYMPVDGKPDRMHVGARALDLTKWIEINSDYEKDLAQKRELLSKKHDEVFLSIPLGDAGSREVLELLSEHLPRVFPDRWPHKVSVDPNLHPLEAASLLVQEDLCVMSQVGNDWILSAASLCFPSRWDVREKIGKNLLGIHGPVPHYAETIGAATQNIFDKLTVERPVWRVNWTVMDSGELHQPTAVRSPDATEITSGNIENALYFRRERQTLRKLPDSGDILFTIRTYSDTFAQVIEQFPDFRQRIGTTIAGSTPELVDYKGWASILTELQSWSKS
jgi:dimethylamine monooxygenase subunit A